jgi:predicted transposase YdaD
MRREEREEGIKEGIKTGMKTSMKETALRMLEAGKYALEEIAGISGLSLEEVKKLHAGLGA